MTEVPSVVYLHLEMNEFEGEKMNNIGADFVLKKLLPPGSYKFCVSIAGVFSVSNDHNTIDLEEKN